MKQFKHIITSGCSFSDSSNNYSWPLQLKTSFDIDSTDLGLSSQGNGLIARKVLHAVHDNIEQGVDPQDILVGIMWSGPDRHDMYFHGLTEQLDRSVKDVDTMNKNPTSYVKNDPGGWLIMNHHWKEERSKRYYAYFHDSIHQRILTYEKILWVQDRLKMLGVNYFMTTFMDEVFSGYYHDNPNITWMRKLIDWSNWLPVSSMHKWCYKYWNDADFVQWPYQVKETGEWHTVVDSHPTQVMHKRFVEEIILPHIKKNFPNYYCPEFKEFISDHV